MVLLRPEDLCIDATAPVTGTVTERVFRGSHYLYTVQVGDAAVLVHGGMGEPHAVGSTVGVRARPA